MVEHRLAKARVASSNLVSRSSPPSDRQIGLATADLERTSNHSDSLARGAVPKW